MTLGCYLVPSIRQIQVLERVRYTVRDSDDLPQETDGTPWPRAWDVWDRDEQTVTATFRTRREAREECRDLNARQRARIFG